MEESEENNMSTEDVTKPDSSSTVKKPKKRSLVERELETSLTSRVTSPAVIADGLSTSRYGRARRLKTECDLIESQKLMMASIIPPENESTPTKAQSPVYRMHASNSPHTSDAPIKTETYLDNQIDNIYQENISLSRFSDETGSPSPVKKFPKVYIRKDLIQKREAEETIMLIKNLFSPSKSSTKSSYTPSSNSLGVSSEKSSSKQNGHVDNTSVVKTLDFDGNKKIKKENKEQKLVLSKNELFELEAKCVYQVGDLAWARMGTFPFWPCIVTRDPYSEMFVRKKLFGRVERDIIHVTFFGDNGRRSWVVDNMLRNYLGQLEFHTTREKFTPEDKKKDPRLYAAYFVSEKKQALWSTSVEEAESLLRHPKRLRVDLFNDMLQKFRASKKFPKSGKITRTDSDVSLSESLYDSLFSEDDVITDDAERSKNRSRNKSFDVSEVVTACLDNMAAKTGITKIQRQSHMDRWLQKAKSKTPEKNAIALSNADKLDKPKSKLPVVTLKLDSKVSKKSKKSPMVLSVIPYGLRKSNGSRPTQTTHNENNNGSNEDVIIVDNIQEKNSIIIIDDNSDVVTKSKSDPNIDNTTTTVDANSEPFDSIEDVKLDTSTIPADNDEKSDSDQILAKKDPGHATKSKKKPYTTPPVKRYRLRGTNDSKLPLNDENDVSKNNSKGDIIIDDDISDSIAVKQKLKLMSNTDNLKKEPLEITSLDQTPNTVILKVEPEIDNTTMPVQTNNELSDNVVVVKQDALTIPAESDKTSGETKEVPSLASNRKKSIIIPYEKRYRLRRSGRTESKLRQLDVSKNNSKDNISDSIDVDNKIELPSDKASEPSAVMSVDHTLYTVITLKDEPDIDNTTIPVQANSELSDSVRQDTQAISAESDKNSEEIILPIQVPSIASKSKKQSITIPYGKRYKLRRSGESKSNLSKNAKTKNISKSDIAVVDDISNNLTSESLSEVSINERCSTIKCVNDSSNIVTKIKDEPNTNNTTKALDQLDGVKEAEEDSLIMPTHNDKISDDIVHPKTEPCLSLQSKEITPIIPSGKRYKLRRSGDSQSKKNQGKNSSNGDVVMVDISNNIHKESKVNALVEKNKDMNDETPTVTSVDDTSYSITKPKYDLVEDNSTSLVQANNNLIISIEEIEQDSLIKPAENYVNSMDMDIKKEPGVSESITTSIIPSGKRYRLRRSQYSECQYKMTIRHDESKKISNGDKMVNDVSNNINVDGNVEALADKNENKKDDTSTIASVDATSGSLSKPKDLVVIDNTAAPFQANPVICVEEVKQRLTHPADNNKKFNNVEHSPKEPSQACKTEKTHIPPIKLNRLRRSSKPILTQDEKKNKSNKDFKMVDDVANNIHANDIIESLTKTVEDANKKTLIENNGKDLGNIHSKEEAHRKDFGISHAHESNRDSVDIMEVDQKAVNAQIDVQADIEPIVSSKAEMDCAMEVDVVHLECQAEKSHLKFETVSNECVEDNCNIKRVPGLQEAQTVVTIEASVTEMKNDDTIIDKEDGRQQESNNKPEPSISTERKPGNIDFLDVIIGEKTGMANTTQVTLHTNMYSTPKKFNHETMEAIDSLQQISSTKLNIEKFFRNSEKIMHQNDNTPGKFSEKQEIDSAETDSLNVSGNSESILQLSDEIDTLLNESCHTTLESEVTPLINESNKSESVLECSQANVNNAEKRDTELKFIVNNNLHDSTKFNFTSTEKHESSTRPYVESPTFTQLLESEEFFRDVNDTHESKSNHTCANQHGMKEVIELNKHKTLDNGTDQNVSADYEDDEESEDEPSPEYESLDEDITEDFRKHMMSIESNITDKKDEEQIVKICNEIAEKAKLSPTKYTIDLQTPNIKDKVETSPKYKIDITPKDMFMTDIKYKPVINPKYNIDIIDKQRSAVLKEIPTIEEKQVLVNQVINKENKLEKTDVHYDNSLKINGDATMTETNGKIVKRTRLLSQRITKKQDSSDFKIKPSEIEQLRKSCEYDPKVIIIPLERDTTGLLTAKDTKTKPPEMEKSKTKNNKYRLTLKRETTPSKVKAVNKAITFPTPDVTIEEFVSLEPQLIADNELVNINKVPKQIIIENDTVETNIPEHVTENVFHNNMNRTQTETPDLIDDSEFDVDTVSVNSEDSEISLPNSVESVPRRNLRSRPERTLEYALNNPEFLKYLELRQDYLMDLHPELDQEEVLTYVYKTWQYEEDLKSDSKKIEDHPNSIKGLKQETPSRKKSKKCQPKDNLENSLREKYEKIKNTIDYGEEKKLGTSDSCDVEMQTTQSISSVDSGVENNSKDNTEVTAKRKTRSKSPILVSETSKDVILSKDEDLGSLSVNSEDTLTPENALRFKAVSPKSTENELITIEDISEPVAKVKGVLEFDTESIGSEDSEVPLHQLKSKILQVNLIDCNKEGISTESRDALNIEVKEEDIETASTISDNEPLLKQKKKKTDKKSLDDPEFTKYLELRRDGLMDENPQLTHNEIVKYLYKTWVYEESSKSELIKNDELEQANLVKGLNVEAAPPKKVRRKPKPEKQSEDVEILPKEKPKRRIIQPYYNENYSDIEDELEMFEIFKTKETAITVVSKTDTDKEKVKSPNAKGGTEGQSPKSEVNEVKHVHCVNREAADGMNDEQVEYVDEIELYFTELTKPRPSVFKGLIREKVCDICEVPSHLVKCKGCNGMFHPDCVKRLTETIDKDYSLPLRAKKKKRKQSRKLKSLEDSGSHSDEKSQDVSADMSIEDIIPPEICTFDADTFETQLAAKMKELMDPTETIYDYFSSDDDTDWKESVAGKCEIVDVKLKRKDPPVDYSDFKCNNCQKHDIPVCFVCKAAVSKTDVKMRQKCHVAHCYKYYHLECLDHWPQTQFNSGEPSRSNKKISEFFEALTCPRHVCHTCVSDDPRGCKTRFCGDKLARCVRCPATYHSFNKCLPAGSQILTASHIICPRHCDDKPGKVPCHVNTGWCFICALGGSLICCEYCPTSFHAECLNIKPPEGNYMCEDCETGRLPLYGEMMWVKLGHYRWWPGIVLHPSEIPENIMAVKHGLGEFVVRFFGQYDHFWVNRGRVFPYQEGDTGRISGQKSKIDADFTLAIEHAQRAYTILKNAEPNEEESLDIASSLLPPHYVKLKCNKPCGSLYGRKVEDPSLSLTQCECNPDEPDPCGLYSQCLNRMLLTECGPTCRAGERCNNRAFEKRQYPRLVPYRTPQRGWGLKTLDHIRAGQFVIEYVGELIDEAEFRRRMRRKHEIRDENFYFLTLDKERMIDAGPKGNVARFMNHCCEPNCETQKWTVLGDVRVGLFAIDNIPANSEVTFNYNLECAGIEKKRCLCGAKRCSGYIGAKPKQEESHSKKGKDGKLAAKRTYKKKKLSNNQEESPSTKTKLKRPLGRPPKPKELTEIEKDLLIIKSATNCISSDESSRSQSLDDKNPKSLKRKRTSISTDEVSLCNGQDPSVKKQKCEEKTIEVGD